MIHTKVKLIFHFTSAQTISIFCLGVTWIWRTTYVVGNKQTKQIFKDTCVQLPQLALDQTLTHTSYGTDWRPAKDCGTTWPDLVTPKKTDGPKKQNKTLTDECSSWTGYTFWSAGLTSTSRRWDSCSALIWRREFPALVTKTTGTLYFPFPSTRFLKHCLAAGIGVLPRTRTPSMSKSRPKDLWLWEGLKKQTKKSTQTHISQFQEMMLLMILKYSKFLIIRWS